MIQVANQSISALNPVFVTAGHSISTLFSEKNIDSLFLHLRVATWKHTSIGLFPKIYRLRRSLPFSDPNLHTFSLPWSNSDLGLRFRSIKFRFLFLGCSCLISSSIRFFLIGSDWAFRELYYGRNHESILFRNAFEVSNEINRGVVPLSWINWIESDRHSHTRKIYNVLIYVVDAELYWRLEIMIAYLVFLSDWLFLLLKIYHRRRLKPFYLVYWSSSSSYSIFCFQDIGIGIQAVEKRVSWN